MESVSGTAEVELEQYVECLLDIQDHKNVFQNYSK